MAAVIFDTSTLTPAGTGDPFQDYQLYNGLDCCLTFEIHERLSELFGSGGNMLNAEIYNFERAMQAPALEMMLRGLRVDRLAVDAAVRFLRKQQDRLHYILFHYGHAVWDRPIGPRTSSGPADLKKLFYEHMNLPVQYAVVKGVRKPATNRDALEKLQDYFYAQPICKAILAFRDLAKQIEFLTSKVDPDGRIRTSYNVAGTETGRWSSSSNAFGTGTNLQNFPDRLRSIFIADEGRKLAYCDLEQAESWIVGIRSWLVSSDRSYLDAIQSGDLHTSVARMVWPELAWTGDLRADRAIAEGPFYRDYSYRDMAKRGGHGTNYYGTAPTMAKHLKVQPSLMKEFQHAYFTAFPGIGGTLGSGNTWHRWVAERLQLDGHLTTLLGRTRHFFGRLNDDTTLREAIAFEPQSVVGDLLNLAAWRVWKHGDRRGVRLLAQLHDAILIDYPENAPEDEVKEFVTSLMRTEINAGGETFIIPNDFSSGWNWGKYSPRNTAGVRKYKGREDRTRPPTTGLDRVVPSFN
jgi:DNA polymerase-1